MHYNTKTTAVYFTVHFLGGTGGYRNVRKYQQWGCKGGSDVYYSNNCWVVQEGINWSFIYMLGLKD
jgi:hypothetical protein